MRFVRKSHVTLWLQLFQYGTHSLLYLPFKRSSRFASIIFLQKHRCDLHNSSSMWWLVPLLPLSPISSGRDMRRPTRLWRRELRCVSPWVWNHRSRLRISRIFPIFHYCFECKLYFYLRTAFIHNKSLQTVRREFLPNLKLQVTNSLSMAEPPTFLLSTGHHYGQFKQHWKHLYLGLTDHSTS